MYFTNGVDAPKYFDGTEVVDIAGLPAGCKARIIALHLNHLLLFWLEESGVSHPQRERWSDIGSDSSWNVSVNYVDHVETEDHIITVEALAVYMIIYKERTILRQEYVGSADRTWNWVTVVTGEGAVTADSVINLGTEHRFWGNSNVYRYLGGFDIEPIGDNIFDVIFSATNGELNPEAKPRISAVYVEEYDEIWFFYPISGDTYPSKMARLNLSNNAWSFRKFPFEISGYGFYSHASAVTWATAVGTWADAIGPWIGVSLQAGAPTVLLCDATGNRMTEHDFSATDDMGTDIDYVVETGDMFVPNRDLRFDRYEFRLMGSSILIEVSVNGGQSYITLGTASPGIITSRVRMHKQLVGRTIRFRFSGSGPFALEFFGFVYKRETI
jgi:hypothetical protein